MYHYTSDTQTPDGIGGHIAVYVLVQLNTSSTGSQQIALQVLTRPSQDFNFFQIRPIPTTDGEVITDETEQLVQSLDSRISPSFGASVLAEMATVVIAPQVQTGAVANSFGVRKLDGQYLNDNAGLEVTPILENLYSTILTADNTAEGITTITVSQPYPAMTESSSFKHDIRLTIEGKEYDVKTVPKNSTFTFRSTSASGMKGKLCSITTLACLEREAVVPRKLDSESFVYFKTQARVSSSNIPTYQTFKMAQLLKSGLFKNIISEQQTIILDMYDAELDIPIHRCKLSYDGALTTKGKAAQIDIKASTLRWKFVQIGLIGEPIPSPPRTYTLNAALSQYASATDTQNIS